ncbi:MAG TPA: nucleotide exchange factor GrpE [Gemmatimonadales bacterium]|jgi:molecular chaperone GrpE
MTDPNSTDPFLDPASPAADTAPPSPDQPATAGPVGGPPMNDPPGDDRLLRLAAEYDNYRKRTAREKTEAFDRGAGALASRLLDALDDIDRLAASEPGTTTYETFRGAFELIQRKLQKELELAGLRRIDPAGAVFDPHQHDAVAVVAPETPEQDHTVKTTFQTGYEFKGTVLRPARVQVYSATGAA